MTIKHPVVTIHGVDVIIADDPEERRIRLVKNFGRSYLHACELILGQDESITLCPGVMDEHLEFKAKEGWFWSAEVTDYHETHTFEPLLSIWTTLIANPNISFAISFKKDGKTQAFPSEIIKNISLQLKPIPHVFTMGEPVIVGDGVKGAFLCMNPDPTHPQKYIVQDEAGQVMGWEECAPAPHSSLPNDHSSQ